MPRSFSTPPVKISAPPEPSSRTSSALARVLAAGSELPREQFAARRREPAHISIRLSQRHSRAERGLSVLPATISAPLGAKAMARASSLALAPRRAVHASSPSASYSATKESAPPLAAWRRTARLRRRRRPRPCHRATPPARSRWPIAPRQGCARIASLPAESYLSSATSRAPLIGSARAIAVEIGQHVDRAVSARRDRARSRDFRAAANGDVERAAGNQPAPRGAGRGEGRGGRIAFGDRRPARGARGHARGADRIIGGAGEIDRIERHGERLPAQRDAKLRREPCARRP